MKIEDFLPYFWPGIAVLWFSISAILIVTLFMEDNEFLIGAVVSTGLCAGPIWHYIVEPAENSIIKHGLFAGLATGIAVHPTYLFLMPLFEGELSLAPFVAIWFSPWGLAFYGYLTLPGGVLAGGLLGVIRHFTARNPDIPVFNQFSG